MCLPGRIAGSRMNILKCKNVRIIGGRKFKLEFHTQKRLTPNRWHSIVDGCTRLQDKIHRVDCIANIPLLNRRLTFLNEEILYWQVFY